MEQANISQHLAVLRAKQLVVNRKARNQVFYSVRDPIILKVLAPMCTRRTIHLLRHKPAITRRLVVYFCAAAYRRILAGR